MRGKVHAWKRASKLRCLGVLFPELDLDGLKDDVGIGRRPFPEGSKSGREAARRGAQPGARGDGPPGAA